MSKSSSRVVTAAVRSEWPSVLAWPLMLGMFLAAAPVGHAADPAWWQARGTVVAENASAPYTVVNQGQLKGFTACAVAELNADLPGGAGDALNALVAGWQADYAANAYATDPTNPAAPFKPADFQAVTVGQLKYVANLVDTRLQAAGFLSALPAWIKANPASDGSAAVAGQLKEVFAFDFPLDPSGSGLPVAWENKYFGRSGMNAADDTDGDGVSNYQEYLNGTDPSDFFDGGLPTLTIVGGDQQTGAPGGLLPAALAVQVADGAGHPLYNAPVQFQVLTGGGQLQATNNAPAGGTCVVRTDYEGQVRAYFTLPNQPNTTCKIQVAVVGNNAAVNRSLTSFTAQSDGGGNHYTSPFALTNLIETINPDGSEDLHWVNCPENTSPIPLWNKVNGQWVKVVTVPAGTTSYHFDKP